MDTRLKNGSANVDCYLQVIGPVFKDSFAANIEGSYYSGGGACPVQRTVRRGTQEANPTVGYHFFANFLSTSYGTSLISESNDFIFDGGVQASFNPNWTWGAIKKHPASVQDGMTFKVKHIIKYQLQIMSLV